ncbi:MAG: hypothetical protein KatS3mg002_0250 [Candidatus Woesearchaeota archaeon]|nr:MAG: hypothetical protein KatS3mg002_0250 [Candidatus Woesearchaeota archaeon]
MLVPIFSKFEPTLLILPDFLGYSHMFRVNSKIKHKKVAIVHIKDHKVKHIFYSGQYPTKLNPIEVCPSYEIKEAIIYKNNFSDIIAYIKQELKIWNLNAVESRVKIRNLCSMLDIVHKIDYPVTRKTKNLTDEEKFYFLYNPLGNLKEDHSIVPTTNQY